MQVSNVWKDWVTALQSTCNQSTGVTLIFRFPAIVHCPTYTLTFLQYYIEAQCTLKEQQLFFYLDTLQDLVLNWPTVDNSFLMFVSELAISTCCHLGTFLSYNLCC